MPLPVRGRQKNPIGSRPYNFRIKNKKGNAPTLDLSRTIRIEAPVEQVWRALTDPSLIKQYLCGTETSTDWKPGSSIKFHGEWQGKKYEDKGKVIAVRPNQLLQHTY